MVAFYTFLVILLLLSCSGRDIMLTNLILSQISGMGFIG
jgi:hypothetical protein